MALIIRRAVDKIYASLIPDAVSSFSASFRYRFLVVTLMFVMGATAIFAAVAF